MHSPILPPLTRTAADAEAVARGVPPHLLRLRIYRPGLPPYPIFPPKHVYGLGWERMMPKEWKLIRARRYDPAKAAIRGAIEERFGGQR